MNNLRWNWNQNKKNINQKENVFQNDVSKIAIILLRIHCVHSFRLVPYRHDRSWAQSQYKDSLYRCGDFHYKDKMVMRLSYLYNGNSNASKTAFLLWDRPLVIIRSGNGLASVWHQAIIRTHTDLLPWRPKRHISIKLYWKYKYFHSRKCIWNYWPPNVLRRWAAAFGGVKCVPR